MPPMTQAEVFIATLKEMHDVECDRAEESAAKKARLREHVKTTVRRFVDAYWSDYNGIRQASDINHRVTRFEHFADERGRED